MRTLFVSPHLDDVALSCPGALLAALDRGYEVTVATVFTDGAPASRYARRRAEDRAALERVGARVLHLGLRDAGSRPGYVPSFTALALREALEARLLRQVTRALEAIVGAEGFDEVWLPAGVGEHVDHRLVFLAGAGLCRVLRHYEERPYGWAPVLARLRRHALEGGAPRGSLGAATILRQLDAGGCGALLAAGERTPVAQRLAARTRIARPATGTHVRIRTTRHPASRLARARALVAGYESELRWLFGGREPVARWARLAAPGGQLIERRWQIEAKRARRALA